ncbi:unnamed protein product, partial [Ectocarpus sp. 8 AP-2014]
VVCIQIIFPLQTTPPPPREKTNLGNNHDVRLGLIVIHPRRFSGMYGGAGYLDSFGTSGLAILSPWPKRLSRDSRHETKVHDLPRVATICSYLAVASNQGEFSH